jgi:hypothetical protein
MAKYFNSDTIYVAKPDIKAALKIQLDNTIKTLIGYLVGISQSSLVLEYLPMDYHSEDIINKQCKVVINNFSTQGIIEYDELSPRKSFFGLQSRQIKIVFSDRLSISEIQPFIR